MCCSIYVNGICLNAWDLVKIEVGFLGFLSLEPGWQIALVVQEQLRRGDSQRQRSCPEPLGLKDPASSSPAPAVYPANSLRQQYCFS